MIAVMRALCLSFHAGYRCQHAGACCTAGWRVAAQAETMEAVRAQPVRWLRGDRAFVPGPEVDGVTEFMAVDEDGACVFFDSANGRLCAIHRDAGVAALPAACRHFPRKILRDGRGLLISLSHFCPTAAALLTTSTPATIVEAPPSLLVEEPIEGLDAREALPPLVRPDLLSDLDGYGAWERAVVEMFGADGVTAEAALDAIANATEDVRRWTPSEGPLEERVRRAFSREPEFGRTYGDERVVKNYLAARAFGNWIAYQGRGLRTVVEWLRICLATVRDRMQDLDVVEAVRQADMFLLHEHEPRDFIADTISLERRPELQFRHPEL
jgi:Fe-S-cluster containining protein